MNEKVNPQQGETLEWHRIYTAGLFDGEGCISLVVQSSKTRSPMLRVYISQCTRQVSILYRIKELFGGHVYLSDKSGNGQYRWYLTDTKASAFLFKIYDYLYIKRIQAAVSLAFQGVKTDIRNCSGRHSYPDNITSFFNRCRKLLMKLNQEGVSPAAETEREELIFIAKELREKYATVHSTPIVKV